jgi:hypothetical protein
LLTGFLGPMLFPNDAESDEDGDWMPKTMPKACRGQKSRL